MNSQVVFRGHSDLKLFEAYKYTSAEYGYKNILDNVLHFSSPERFNDVYDGRFLISANECKCIMFGGGVRNITNKLFENSNFKFDKKIKKIIEETSDDTDMVTFLSKVPADFALEVIKILSYLIRHRIVASNNKVACLSERNDSLAMWAYYADNYTGVCLKYSLFRDSLLFKNCHKVQYSDIIYSGGLDSFDFYFYKSTEWQHEHDWRIVADIGTRDNIQTQCISAVYLGCKITEQSKKKIINIAKERGLEIYETHPNDRKYAIDFIKIS